jgi:hypothetical protein
MCLLSYLLLAKTVLILWEQPKGSMMEAHPRFAEMIRRTRLYRCHLTLWDFGGESAKPLWMYSQKPWLGELYNHRSRRQDSNGIT